jgi:hypothetical protein
VQYQHNPIRSARTSMSTVYTPAQWHKAERDIAALRQEFPDASQARLMRHLIKQACLKAGAVGGGTTAVSLIPGVGKMLGWAVNFAGDAAMSAALQRDLILRVFALYGHQPVAEDDVRMAEWMAGVGIGAVALMEQVGGGFAKSIGKRVLGRFIRRGLPVVEVIGSSASHVVGTYLVARKAQAHCLQSAKTTARIEEPDKRKLRNWTMLSVATVLDQDQPKTVKDALRQKASTED